MTEGLQKLKERGLDHRAPQSDSGAAASGMAPPTDFFSSFLGGAAQPSGKEVKELPPAQLHDFQGHTFQINTEAADYQALYQSIAEHGIQQPIIVRLHPQIVGAYEIIAGHRRNHIARAQQLERVPCIVTACDDDTAIQWMTTSNIQRPDWLPSEKAKTYKAHLEATQRKTGIRERQRTDLTAGNSFPQLRNRDEAAKVWGITGKSLDTYIKLNDLCPALLELVDSGRISVMAGYHLAFMVPDAQTLILSVLSEYPKKKISNTKGKELRRADETGELTRDYVLRVLGIQKALVESQFNIRMGSSILTNKKTIQALLSDPERLIRIERLLVEEARHEGLPLE